VDRKPENIITHRLYGLVVSWSTDMLAGQHILRKQSLAPLWHELHKGNNILVLMHSGIVNGYQLLCDAHTVSEEHRQL